MEAATRAESGGGEATCSPPTIRRATLGDIEQIHCAHTTSIRKCCTKEYSPEKIEAWAGRPLNVEMWTNRIQNEYVLVIEQNGVVEGFTDVHFPDAAQSTVCELKGFYFTPAVRGRGIGRDIVRALVETARQRGMTKMLVRGSLTSAPFYEKVGFRHTGPDGTISVQGVELPYLGFELDL